MNALRSPTRLDSVAGVNVLYDLQAYSFSPHGGVARIFDELLTRFSQRPDFSGTLFPSAPPRRSPPQARNLKVKAFPSIPVLRHLLRPVEAAYWNAQRLDLQHPTFYPPEDRWPKLPAVVHVYDLIHETIALADDMPDHAAFLAIKKRWLQRAQRIVCISQATRDELLRLYDLDEKIVRVVPLACGPAFRRLDEAEAKRLAAPVLKGVEGPFMLYIGSRQRYKNFHRLLHAFAAWSRFRDVALVVVGGRPNASDAAALDLSGAARNVHFVGHADDEALNALYNRARFFVYPSLCEGFGIPLLEAMAAGCPIAASDLPVFREIAGGGPDYFDPLSADSMHAAFDRALARREDSNFQRQPPAPTRDFRWERCAEETWNLYREIA